MLIKNRFGIEVQVSEEQGKRMIACKEATLITEKEEKKEIKNECPYCREKNPNDKHINKCFKKSPLISVIIPSRVGEEIQSLKSIENQTYKNIEIIIEYDKKKQGSSFMRNKGMKKSKGEYLFFCDNDVALVPDALSELYKKLKESKGYSWCFARVEIDGVATPKKDYEAPTNKKTFTWLNYFYCISTMALISRKAKPVWDNSLQRYNDWDLFAGMDRRGEKGIYLDKIILTTKNRPNGITMQNDHEQRYKKLVEKYQIGEKTADIIIPHQDRHDHLKQCLEKLSFDEYNIIVVSGGTFAENCNKGAKIATTENLIFMNDDIIPKSEVLQEMVENKADIVGATQIIPSYNQNIVYGIGYKVKNDVVSIDLAINKDTFRVPAGFLFKVKKKVWEELGGLDEKYKNGGEDQDIFLRAMEKDYTIDYVLTPTIHLHSQSRDRHKNTIENEKKLNKDFDLKRIKKIMKKYGY